MAERTSERVVRGACPHDCPDTCAMRVTVDETGRATHVVGDAAHPVTAGFLWSPDVSVGRVSWWFHRGSGGERTGRGSIARAIKAAGVWEAEARGVGSGVWGLFGPTRGVGGPLGVGGGGPAG